MEGTEGRDEPVRIIATLRCEDDCYRFAGHLATSAGLACALCNNVFSQVYEIDFSLRYTPGGNSPDPSASLPEERELPPEECDVEALDDQGRIDLMSFTRDQIYLALPLQPRCREDCRGLCSRCGNDLNHVTCACSSPAPDPRLAPLAELRNRF
jgi:uncharacterized protein